VIIGLIVDGHAELEGLPYVLSRLGIRHQILKPLRCDLQPTSSPTRMASEASRHFTYFLRRKVDRIVLLIDKEARAECTGELAQEIEREARAKLAHLSASIDLFVVLKVTKLENWLVADPEALTALPGLIKKPERIAKQVAGGRADAVDALTLLKNGWAKKGFKKPACAVAIFRKLDPVRAAANSRSFRKLLKTLGHPDFGG
jgi:Domain of unknown function (DUF4276)